MSIPTMKNATREADTDIIYLKTIDNVMKRMQLTMRQNGYPDSTIAKIREKWRDNLKRPPKSGFAYISPLKFITSPKPPSPVIKKPESPPKVPSPPSFSDYSDMGSSEEEYQDPALVEFERVKRENEQAQIKKKMQDEEVESISIDDNYPSDDDTNLDLPEATAIIHCLYEEVKRKGTGWSMNFKSCVFQKNGISEKFLKLAQAKVSSKKLS